MTRDELYKLCDYLECNDASMEAQCEAAAFIRQTLTQRTWVELTKGEIESWELPVFPTVVEFAWFVEAKIKAKNAG